MSAIRPESTHPLVAFALSISSDAIQAAKNCDCHCASCPARDWCRALGYDPDGLLEEAEEEKA